jgi:predicted ArsR family transcriptional regulator
MTGQAGRPPGSYPGPGAGAGRGEGVPGGGSQRDPAVLAALGDPARRLLYEYITAQDHPVSRDEAADATGLKRPTAAFHLERLAADGLLDVRFARLSGRTGPGAGRTAKLYVRAHRQIDVSLPPRRYLILGDVLASALDEAQRRPEAAGEAVARAAERAGRDLAAGCEDLAQLAGAGYQPRVRGDGVTQLANCPFHELVVRHPQLVCTLNLHLLQAALACLGRPERAQLDPAPGRCCVTIVPA